MSIIHQKRPPSINKVALDQCFAKLLLNHQMNEQEVSWSRAIRYVAYLWRDIFSRDDSLSISYEALRKLRSDPTPQNILTRCNQHHENVAKRQGKRLKGKKWIEKNGHRIPVYVTLEEVSVHNDGFDSVDDNDELEHYEKLSHVYGEILRRLRDKQTHKQVYSDLGIPHTTYYRIIEHLFIIAGIRTGKQPHRKIPKE